MTYPPPGGPPPGPPGPPGPPPAGPPPGGPPPIGPPPGGPPPYGPLDGDDPRRRTRRTRNIIIAVIIGIAIIALLGSCVVKLGRGGDNAAKNYVTTNYQRQPSLDETDVQAYVADGSPTQVASDITSAGAPTDQRSGDSTTTGNESGTQFLQYPDYLIGLFPYGTNQTKVMVSKDYTSGYNHYHSYVGGFWVPTPNYSGSGSSNRGGGSGGGGK